jgi:hypothetical protein
MTLARSRGIIIAAMNAHVTPPHEPLPGGPLVIQTQGYTPQLWADRTAIFFTNVQSLFFDNEALTKILMRQFVHADSYGARLVPVLGLLYRGGGNAVVLEGAPDASLCRYFAEDLGLTLPEIHVLNHADYLKLNQSLEDGVESPTHELISKLIANNTPLVDGFVTDATVERIARRLGKRTLSTRQGSKNGNNKLLLHQHLESVGLPVFETEVAQHPDEVGSCLQALAKRGFRHAVAKAQLGASGVGLMKIVTSNPQPTVPQAFFYEGPVMVQGWLESGRDGITAIHSPSVQMFLDDEAVYLYDLTEQILSHESVHEGNESPPPYLDALPDLAVELFRQAGVAGQWLHAQGYRGTASADFLVATQSEPGTFQAYVCEVNARLTGATYPSMLARHFLPRGAWLMRNLMLKEATSGRAVLRYLEEHGDLFHPGMERGVIPENFILNEHGRVEKGQFLCIGSSTAECHELLLRAERDLPIDWDYLKD